MIKHRGSINVNEPFNGLNPLHCAVQNGDLLGIQRLLDFGADISVTNGHGVTPLHFACLDRTEMSYKLCKLLLNRGADCNLQDSYGRTPLHRAVIFQAPKLIELLLDHGADLTAVDGEGRTALHAAVKYYRSELCELLLSRGARFDEKNNAVLGKVISGISRGRRMAEITVEVLLDYGSGMSYQFYSQIVLQLVQNGILYWKFSENSDTARGENAVHRFENY